jgi:hypothetical protein
MRQDRIRLQTMVWRRPAVYLAILRTVDLRKEPERPLAVISRLAIPTTDAEPVASTGATAAIAPSARVA